MKFPCTSCGACCRRVHLVPKFPEPIKSDGSCIHLKDDNTCAIYDTRPLICNIDKFFDAVLSDKMERKEFYDMNMKVCEQYQKEDGLI